MSCPNVTEYFRYLFCHFSQDKKFYASPVQCFMLMTALKLTPKLEDVMTLAEERS